MSGFRFLDPWHAFLPLESGHVIGLCGGGGKTSLLRDLAARYGRAGLPVVVTTTTRCEVLDWPELREAEAGTATAAVEPDPTRPLFVHRGRTTDGKWAGLEPEEVDALGEALPGAVLLVETDGSAGKPLKLHRPDEPRWPGRTSLALVVMGLGAVGRPVADVLHRHGRLEPPPGLAPILAPDVAADWPLMAALLGGEDGYLSRIPAGVPPVLALTQLDLCDDSIGLFEFSGRAMDEFDLPLVLFVQRTAEATVLRCACRGTS